MSKNIDFKYSVDVGEEGKVKDISRLDLRVGKIRDVIEHICFPRMGYMCQVDSGDTLKSDYRKVSWYRIIAGFLEPHYTMRELVGKTVIVLCNVKPGFSRGFYNNGVLLCAKKGDKLELLAPPPRAIAGDKIYIEGYARGKEKVYCPGDWRNETRAFTDMKFVRLFEDNIAPDLKVDAERRVVYREIPFRVEGKDGFVTTEELSECSVTYVDFEVPLYPGQK